MDQQTPFYPHCSMQPTWNMDEDKHPLLWSMGHPASPLIEPMEHCWSAIQPPFSTHTPWESSPAIFPFPDVPTKAFPFHDFQRVAHMLPHRYSTPSSYSARSTTDPGSVYGPDETSPSSSPEIAPMGLLDQPPVDIQGGQSHYHAFFPHGSHGAPTGLHCSMQEIQQLPDEPLEGFSCDDEPHTFSSYPHEGYQPLSVDSYIDAVSVPTQAYQPIESRSPTSKSEPPPMLRRRRASSARTPTSPRSTDKVTKRATPARRATAHPPATTAITRDADRTFPCAFAPYGCHAGFGSKNEWKRHVATQHMRLGYWRCDQCADSKPNDFNRKDLFIQHVRRMHPLPSSSSSSTGDQRGSGSSSPKSSKAKANGAGSRTRKADVEDDALSSIAQRCYKRDRSPPARSCCIFCEHTFEGPKSWDERMEHVGRHMEMGGKKGGTIADGGRCTSDPSSWKRDEETERWLLEEKVAARKGQAGLVLV